MIDLLAGALDLPETSLCTLIYSSDNAKDITLFLNALLPVTYEYMRTAVTNRNAGYDGQ